MSGVWVYVILTAVIVLLGASLTRPCQMEAPAGIRVGHVRGMLIKRMLASGTWFVGLHLSLHNRFSGIFWSSINRAPRRTVVGKASSSNSSNPLVINATSH